MVHPRTKRKKRGTPTGSSCAPNNNFPPLKVYMPPVLLTLDSCLTHAHIRRLRMQNQELSLSGHRRLVGGGASTSRQRVRSRSPPPQPPSTAAAPRQETNNSTPPTRGRTRRNGDPIRSRSTSSTERHLNNHSRHSSGGGGQVSIWVKKPPRSSPGKSSNHSRHTPQRRRRRRSPRSSTGTSRWRQTGIWTIWKVIGFIFRSVSIAGIVIFTWQYAHMTTDVLHMEMKQIASTDWNILGLSSDKNTSNTYILGYQAVPVLEDVQRIPSDNSMGVLPAPGVPEAAGTTTLAQSQSKQFAHPKQPLEVSLPSWVICPDGTNVSACHLCSVTNRIRPCASAIDDNVNAHACQWCPYGALWDTSMPTDYTTSLNQSIVVYDTDGTARRVYHAHIPLDGQCVSTRQTCRAAPPPGESQYNVWQKDVAILQTKVVGELATKAANFVQRQPCASRGYLYCPYGAIHSYHQDVALSGNLTSNAQLQSLNRPAQCLPRRMHCQPTDELFIQPFDIIYRPGSSALVIPALKLIFVPVWGVSPQAWKTFFSAVVTQLPAGGKEDINTPGQASSSFSSAYFYMSNYSRPVATDLWQSPDWTKAIMVRDPLERLVAVYHKLFPDRAALMYRACCDTESSKKNNKEHPTCALLAQEPPKNLTFVQFARLLSDRKGCRPTKTKANGGRVPFLPWAAQADRLETKYWPYVSSVLHSNGSTQGILNLLKRVSATGLDIESDAMQALVTTLGQQTASSSDTAQYYPSATLPRKIQQLYAQDYEMPLFGLAEEGDDEAHE